MMRSLLTLGLLFAAATQARAQCPTCFAPPQVLQMQFTPSVQYVPQTTFHPRTVQVPRTVMVPQTIVENRTIMEPRTTMVPMASCVGSFAAPVAMSGCGGSAGRSSGGLLGRLRGGGTRSAEGRHSGGGLLSRLHGGRNRSKNDNRTFNGAYLGVGQEYSIPAPSSAPMQQGPPAEEKAPPKTGLYHDDLAQNAWQMAMNQEVTLASTVRSCPTGFCSLR